MHITTAPSGSILTPFEQATFNALCLADGLSYTATMVRMMQIMEGLDMQIDTTRADGEIEMADQIEESQRLLLASYITGYACDS